MTSSVVTSFDGTLNSYLDLFCERDPSFSDKASLLYASYLKACEEFGITKRTINTQVGFTRSLPFSNKHSHGITTVFGVRRKQRNEQTITQATVHFPEPMARQPSFPEKIQSQWESAQDMSLSQAVISHSYEERLASVKSLVGNAPRWCLCIKANCGFGKTERLVEFIKENGIRRVLFVTFRRTLVDKQVRELSANGFVSYLDYSTIRSIDDVERLICQVDSLAKVRGEYDLLVLDEIKSTCHQLVTFAKNKLNCAMALSERIRETPKVYVADALLGDGEISYLAHCGRKDVFVHWNHTQRHSDKMVMMVQNKTLLAHLIGHKVLVEHKKVCVATGSKKYADLFTSYLIGQNPQLQSRVKSYTAKTHDGSDPVGEWKKYDVVIYSPCVAAGNSFTEQHFDIIVGYFPAVSCGPSMALQMLFRSRNANDNTIYLCVETAGAHQIFESNCLDETKQYLTVKDILLHTDPDLVIGAAVSLKMSYVDKQLDVTDPYFHMYASVLHDVNEGKTKYISVLMGYLKMMGVRYGGCFDVASLSETAKEEVKMIGKEFKAAEAAIERKECVDIASAPPISYETAQSLGKKEHLSPDEYYALTKYRIAEQFRISEISPEFVAEVKDDRRSHRRLVAFERCYGFHGMEDFTNRMRDALCVIAGNGPSPIYDYESNGARIIESNRLSEAHQCLHATNLAFSVGVVVLEDQSIVRNPPLDKLREYVNKYGATMEYIFGCRVPTTDCDAGKLVKWASERLKSTFAITLKKKGADIEISRKWIPMRLSWDLNRRVFLPSKFSHQPIDASYFAEKIQGSYEPDPTPSVAGGEKEAKIVPTFEGIVPTSRRVKVVPVPASPALKLNVIKISAEGKQFR